MSAYLDRVNNILSDLGIKDENPALHTGLEAISSTNEKQYPSYSPVDGEKIASTERASEDDFKKMMDIVKAGAKEWATWTAPARGEVVRQIGDALREKKDELGMLVSYEMGKIHPEGKGEVQEIIDICDFAVGQSRQLYGKTMPSERPAHRMYEQWHPLGTVGVITAFNFPVAVWGWNVMLSAVCGNANLWKPSEKTPLTALACQHIIQPILKANNVPAGVFSLMIGDRDTGERMANSRDMKLISATGSVPMGQKVGENIAKRLGKSLLELGGNNAIIVTPNADQKLAHQATVFAAVGTSGQRCTSARRLILHESIYDEFLGKLKAAYEQLESRIGNPLEDGTLIGPLIDAGAVSAMQTTIGNVQREGGNVVTGGGMKALADYPDGHYVIPAIVEAEPHYESVQKETFAPILYVLKYKTLDEAIAIQNGVPQGLSSSIFTENMKELERFLSAQGSDCGIANVNIGPSGAEIGGAFGGEKETGGGRESGSDSWKAYMRRQTVTINYSDELPLAQGLRFE
ncbi:MAG: aldehyde dehydrogenase family protein [Bacteroidota bacterium]